MPVIRCVMQSKHKCVIRIEITFETRAQRERIWPVQILLLPFRWRLRAVWHPLIFCSSFIFCFSAGSTKREQRSKVKCDHANCWAHVYVKVTSNNGIFNNPAHKSILGCGLQMNNNYNSLRISQFSYTDNKLFTPQIGQLAVNIPFI